MHAENPHETGHEHMLMLPHNRTYIRKTVPLAYEKSTTGFKLTRASFATWENRMESGFELSSNADFFSLSTQELVDPCLTKPLQNCKALGPNG